MPVKSSADMVNIPIKRISWKFLAVAHQCPASNPSCTYADMENDVRANFPGDPEFKAEIKRIKIDYLIRLVLSLLMAFFTFYIFYLMLDTLPFVGAGMGGDKDSMPQLGQGGLSMPGNKLFDKMKAGMGKLAGAGGGA